MEDSTDRSAVLSYNAGLFEYYKQLLSEEDSFLSCCEKLVPWLSERKAYYEQARPEILDLLLTARRTVRTTVGLSRRQTLLIARFADDHPFVVPYMHLVTIVFKYRDYFIEDNLQAQLDGLYLGLRADVPDSEHSSDVEMESSHFSVDVRDEGERSPGLEEAEMSSAQPTPAPSEPSNAPSPSVSSAIKDDPRSRPHFPLRGPDARPPPDALIVRRPFTSYPGASPDKPLTYEKVVRNDWFLSVDDFQWISGDSPPGAIMLPEALMPPLDWGKEYNDENDPRSRIRCLFCRRDYKSRTSWRFHVGKETHLLKLPGERVKKNATRKKKSKTQDAGFAHVSEVHSAFHHLGQ